MSSLWRGSRSPAAIPRPPHSLKNSTEPLCFRRAPVTWKNRRSLLWNPVPVQLCNSEGIFCGCCSAGFHPPGSLEKQDAAAYSLRHRLCLWNMIYNVIIPQMCALVNMFFEFRGGSRGNFLQKVSPYPFKNLFAVFWCENMRKEDMIEKDMVRQDIINKDIIICTIFSCRWRECRTFSLTKSPSVKLQFQSIPSYKKT